jgi:type II secretory pathway pseudopilin PulG
MLEVLISVAITSVVLGTIGMVSLRSTRNAQFEQAQAVGLALGRQALDQLGKDIDAAFKVESTGTCGATNGTCFTLTVPAYNATAIISGAWDTISYWYVTSTKTLHRSVSPGTGSSRTSVTDQVVATGLSSITFQYVALFTQATNGSQSAFTLDAYPPTGASVKAVANGSNVSGTPNLNVTTKTVTLASAPATGSIDIWYPFNPTNSSNSALFAHIRQIVVTVAPNISVNGTSVSPTNRLTFTLRNRDMT